MAQIPGLSNRPDRCIIPLIFGYEIKAPRTQETSQEA